VRPYDRRAVKAAGFLCLAVGALTTALALIVPDLAAVAVVLSTAGTGYVVLIATLVVASRRADTAARRAATTDDRCSTVNPKMGQMIFLVA